MESNIYGGEAINGNTTNKTYKDFLKSKYVLIECFKEDPEEYSKFKTIWCLLSTISEGFHMNNRNDSLNESLAKNCEEFGRKFPVFFNRNITRKMHTLSIVVPKFLREDGDLFYKVSKVEQMGEKLHKDFNDLENQYRNIIDKPKKVT